MIQFDDILYDCYDENVNSLGIIFAKDCKELLEKEPRVKYVLGLDYFTRERKWHVVTERWLEHTTKPEQILKQRYEINRK